MTSSTTERNRHHLVGLKMPSALEALLGEEYTTRESRRIKMAL